MYSNIQRTQSSKPGSVTSFDEHVWVTQIRRTLEEKLEDKEEVPVSIFSVPKILMATDPNSYTPQQIAIGPYHYRRPDLYEMERYKLSAARKIRNKLEIQKFDDIVRWLTKHEGRIRACYHRYLSLSGETLAWMMALDGAFLLEFLQGYAFKQGKSINLGRLSSRMSHLFDSTGQKATHNALMRDMAMLENQIPLFVLRKLLEFHFPTLEEADHMLYSMLLGFSKQILPFKMTAESSSNVKVSDCAHLLDFLYQLVTPKIEAKSVSEQFVEISELENIQGKDCEAVNGEEASAVRPWNSLKRTLSEIWEFFRSVWNGLRKLRDHDSPVVNLFKKLFILKPIISFLLTLPLKILSAVPGLKVLTTPIETMLSSPNKKEDKLDDDDDDESSKANKPPLIEEIAIPSVTDLTYSGVHFRPTRGNISAIAFDAKTMTFSLPALSLDVNTGTILRNLVAYEASNNSGPLVFTRFTELINGIIDTEDDVKLLREKGIILSSLKSDEEVANLCNGMSKSIRLTKVPFLDKVIEDVNKHYEGGLKAKFERFMKSYVFGSWKLLTLLATILMLLLMGLQSFCSVYTCAQIFNRFQVSKSD